jgi:hypothetical protein
VRWPSQQCLLQGGGGSGSEWAVHSGWWVYFNGGRPLLGGGREAVGDGFKEGEAIGQWVGWLISIVGWCVR